MRRGRPTDGRMATDVELYELREAMIAAMWAWWRLYRATNGGETADRPTAFRLWALRQAAREARYVVLEAREGRDESGFGVEE